MLNYQKREEKKADDKDKENISTNVNHKYVMYNGGEWYQTQLDQLHSLLNTFAAMTTTMNEYNYVQQQQQVILLQKQQNLFPIFNNDRSILLARPQSPKTKRSSNRPKKNSAALQF